MKKDALKAAFPYTIPVGLGYLFLGLSYGFLTASKGFSRLYPTITSIFIYAGSMEFVTIELMLSAFNLPAALMMTLLVNARHLFYGLAMLDRYKDCGKKKFYMIFSLSDETFALTSSVDPPEGIDRSRFYFWISFLDQVYRVLSTSLGGLIGSLIKFNTQGIDFVMTALFMIIFLGHWEKKEKKESALVGLLASFLCLVLFGDENFMIPAMVIIVVVFALKANFEEKKEEVYDHC